MKTRLATTSLTGILALALLGHGCASSGNSASAAAVVTATALVASGVSRATGGCYAACTPGTRCNPDTGLCEPVDCGGCDDGQVCDAATMRCVPKAFTVVRTRPEDPVRTVDEDFRRTRPGSGKDLPERLRLFPVPTSTQADTDD